MDMADPPKGCRALPRSYLDRPRSPEYTVALAVVILHLVGDFDNKLGSLCQVASSDGIGMERLCNAWEPGKRSWVGRRERCEAPVEDCRHIVCSSKVAPGGSQQVAEWMHSSLSRSGEQMGSKGWSGRFSGESRE
jgi:hypothetical protein